ncbi:Bidirectional sugar transporter sweet14 [Asimina triloba]
MSGICVEGFVQKRSRCNVTASSSPSPLTCKFPPQYDQFIASLTFSITSLSLRGEEGRVSGPHSTFVGRQTATCCFPTTPRNGIDCTASPLGFCIWHFSPTFYRVCKKRSTEGFQSIPYVVALFSAMLWLYYGFVRSNGVMLITINTIGCAIEGSYIVTYLVFAPRKAKIATAKLLLSLNVGVFGLTFLLTIMLAKGSRRLEILGWVCASFSVSVFAAPLSIMRLVIRTKSVEFMPFSLSFFLTLSAIIWFFYGLFLKDMFIALPNVLGFAFGLAQMILYIMYKNSKKTVAEQKLPEQAEGARPTAVIINLEEANQLTDKQSERPIELTEIHV